MKKILVCLVSELTEEKGSSRRETWVQQGFSFLEKKKVYNVIPLLRTALRFKKNDKTHVCRIMFKIYNFKTPSSFNLLLNKKGGGTWIRIFVVKLTFHLSHRKSHVPRWTKFKMFSSQGFDLHGNVFGNC